ncbi:MAG TPA: hypothetical protein VFR06_03030 [Gallionellaceae bacterium]|nr:hypothetical protein [Gallionellaceae bacterium]
MSHKTLLFLSTDHFQAYSLERGVLTDAQFFSDDENGREQFAEYLRKHRAPTYLLTDMIEEDFRQEVVPHLTGASQDGLVQRKFEQYYRNTPFRLARVQQRQSEGRRDDEMLFSALTNPARVSFWLEPILENHIPLAGIYSLPHISLPLVKDIDCDHLLLLSWERNAGLRQTYFFNKRLRFSRLTPLNGSSSFSESIATESSRTRQYLHSLSLTPTGEMLKVLIICHPTDQVELEKQLQNNADMLYTYLDIQQLGHRLKSKEKHGDSDATTLFLSLVASKPPSAQYANADHTHYHLLWRIRHSLYVLAALSAFVGLVWAALLFQDASQHDAESEPLKAQISRIEHDTKQILQSFPATNVSAVDMKNAVILLRKLQDYAPATQEILGGLAGTLDTFPRIITAGVEWKAGTAPAANGGGNAPAQIILFNGELAGFGNDYRSQLKYLDNFQQALTNSGYLVSATSMPLDLSAKGSISNDIGDGSDKPAKFTLQLVWRPRT